MNTRATILLDGETLTVDQLAQATDQRKGGPETLSSVTRKIYEMVREVVPYLDHDESLSDHITAASNLLRENRLLEALPEGDLHWED